MYTYTFVYIYIYVLIQVCAYIYTYTRAYVNMYVYIYVHIDSFVESSPIRSHWGDSAVSSEKVLQKPISMNGQAKQSLSEPTQ